MMKRRSLPCQISDPLHSSHDPLHTSHDPRTACTQDPARVHLSFISAVFLFSQTPFFSSSGARTRDFIARSVWMALRMWMFHCIWSFDGTRDTWNLKRITVGSRRVAQEADFSTPLVLFFTSLFTPVKFNAETHFSLIYFPRQTIHLYLIIGLKYDLSTLFLWWMF